MVSGNHSGSGPDDAEPWPLLEQAAKDGEKSGVRVAYAVGALLANNAGDTDRMRDFLVGYGESLSNTPRNQNFAFFDQYAYEVALHQSDLLWVATKGHRTPELGELPIEPQETSSQSEEDPFGDDFGEDQSEDPFAE